MQQDVKAIPAGIGAASKPDIPDVVSVLARAMRADVSLRTFVDGVALDRRLRTYLAAEASSILEGDGRLDVCRNAGGQILAAAVWEQPDFREMPRQTLRYGPAMLEAVRLRGLRNWLTHRSQFLRLRPLEPHWHLVRLGTDEPFRGRGVGTALLEHRLAKIDVAGDIAHLEASSAASARLYERLGFVAVGEIRLETDTILAMTRPAVNPHN